MPFRPKQNSERAARLGRKLQAPQPALIVPFNQSKTAAQTPELKACSAAHKASVAVAGRTMIQTAELDSLLRQGRRKGLMRRRNPDEPGRIAARLR